MQALGQKREHALEANPKRMRVAAEVSKERLKQVEREGDAATATAAAATESECTEGRKKTKGTEDERW